MLYEYAWEIPEKWYKGSVIGPAHNNTPLAVVRATTLHLFCMDTNDAIQEYTCVDRKWVSGALIPAPDVHGNSDLAAVVCGSQIRLYYQAKNGDIRELQCRGGEWHTGGISTKGPGCLHVFYTIDDPHEPGKWRIMHATSNDTNAHWTMEELTPMLPSAGEGLACVAWATPDNNYKMRLFFPNADDKVVQFGYDSSKRAWDSTPEIPSHTMTPWSYSLAAVAYPDSDNDSEIDLAVFVRKTATGGNITVEMSSQRGEWQETKDLNWDSL
ncbi:hypothetical protein C8J57DRAFT_1242520 [Mycena rebaudengoi]|nr:hypothetical protein C8J57DRAFT_1242520 [Mycena rebaudengoi]